MQNETLKAKVELVVNNIYQRDGQVKPSVLVEEARPSDSPAHDAFEWDDKKAGNEYRLHQARSWIRTVEIVIDDRRENMVHVPIIRKAEPSDEEKHDDSREGYYKPVSIVARSHDEYSSAMAATLARLNTAKESFNRLKEAAVKQGKKLDSRRADKGFALVESSLDQQRASL